MGKKIKNPEITDIHLGRRWEISLYFALMLLAAGLRFWNLDFRAMHYDESIHAFYSWRIFEGFGYQHAPWTHGPLQFYGMALLYRIIGASEYVSRILPAIFGTLLVGTPYFLRNRLGKIGSCFAALFLAISPSILYFSRFARDDIYVLVWSMLLVILLWRYLQEAKNKYLYLSAAVWALFFSTMETSYILFAIFAGFILFRVIKWILSEGIKGFDILRTPGVSLTYLLLIVTLALPLAAPLITIPLGWLHINFPEWSQQAGIGEVNRSWALACISLMFVFTALVGLYWRWRLWFIAGGIFWGIYFLLFTSFFSNIGDGITSGIWGSLAYWLNVHKKNLIYEPSFYYLLLLIIYEFLPFISAITGSIYYWKKKDIFAKFLIYWVITSLFIYGVAGEKPPWLVLHCVLPCILLGSKFIGEALTHLALNQKKLSAKNFVLIIVLVFLVFLTGGIAFRANYRNFEEPVEMLVYSQGTQDVKRIAEEVNALARQKGDADFTVSVDSSLNGSWLSGWYFRKYKIDWIEDVQSVNKPPKGSVLIIKAANEKQMRPYLEKYERIQKVHWIMWYPPFDPISLPKALKSLTRVDTIKKGWRYFLYREPWSIYRFDDAMVYFIK